MDITISDIPADDALASDGALTLLAHLDTVYGFALTLAGNPEAAARLTERALVSTDDHADITLGGDALRDRLLARCADAFTEHVREPVPVASARAALPQTPVHALLLDLPWEQHAAIALVDQFGLTYAAGAGVLAMTVAEFRECLHQGRFRLLERWRTSSTAGLRLG